MYLLRQAVNTTHLHLKQFYRFKLVQDGVMAIYEMPAQLEIEVTFRLIPEESDVWDISQAVIDYTIPMKFLMVLLSDDEFAHLESLCLSKGLTIKRNHNQIEITNG